MKTTFCGWDVDPFGQRVFPPGTLPPLNPAPVVKAHDHVAEQGRKAIDKLELIHRVMFDLSVGKIKRTAALLRIANELAR